MKRLVTIVALLAITAICFVGCGDKVKEDAEAKWEVFKVAETGKIGSESGQGDPIPYDFEYRIAEVDDASYRFKGFISFKKGNTFQEQAYAFIDGNWLPVKYTDLKNDDEIEEKIEDLEEKIEDLKDDIEDDLDFLEKYKKRSEELQDKNEELQTLQKTLEELKAGISE